MTITIKEVENPINDGHQYLMCADEKAVMRSSKVAEIISLCNSLNWNFKVEVKA